MRILHIGANIDDREAEALAHYRASQQRLKAARLLTGRRDGPRCQRSMTT